MNCNHSQGCQRCTTIGKFDNAGHHMSFPKINSPLRTDEGFRLRLDEDHHSSETSPLEEIEGIDMIKDFIVADELHLLHLGIMKKLLLGWKCGGFNFKTKWSARESQIISELLLECNKCMPKEIHRSIRSLECLRFWKGLEFRTFLMYLGVVVLKDHLAPNVYDHFIQLFCAVTICSCKEYLKYVDLASECLSEYVEMYIDIYGIDSISSNVHNLCHMVEDVKRFGHLSDMSTYPFENFLGYLKHLLRQGNRPLEQVAMRVSELANMKSFSNANHFNQKSSLKNKQVRNNETTYNCLITGLGFELANKQGDKWFLTESGQIVEMHYAFEKNSSLFICGAEIKLKYDFFTQPFSSRYLNIYASSAETKPPTVFALNQVKCKLISLPYHDELVFIPLLHTLDKI